MNIMQEHIYDASAFSKRTEEEKMAVVIDHLYKAYEEKYSYTVSDRRSDPFHIRMRSQSGGQ